MTLVSLFRKKLKELNNSVYLHVFETMSDKRLNKKLIDIYDEFDENSGEWFYNFHKSIRQTDFFTEAFQICVEDQRTEEDKIKQKEIYDFLLEHYNKRNVTDGRHKFWEREFPSAYKEWMRLVSLSRKEIKDTIGGHIDMILWELIHMDKENILEKCMSECFKEFKSTEHINKVS